MSSVSKIRKEISMRRRSPAPKENERNKQSGRAEQSGTAADANVLRPFPSTESCIFPLVTTFNARSVFIAVTTQRKHEEDEWGATEGIKCRI